MAMGSDPIADTVIIENLSSSPRQEASMRRATNGSTGGAIQRSYASKYLRDSGIIVCIPEIPVEEVQMGQEQPTTEVVLPPIESAAVLASITPRKRRTAAGFGIAVKKEVLAKINWPPILLVLGVSALVVAIGGVLLYWFLY
jgi:hypothetical protein